MTFGLTSASSFRRDSDSAPPPLKSSRKALRSMLKRRRSSKRQGEAAVAVPNHLQHQAWLPCTATANPPEDTLWRMEVSETGLMRAVSNLPVCMYLYAWLEYISCGNNGDLTISVLFDHVFVFDFHRGTSGRGTWDLGSLLASLSRTTHLLLFTFHLKYTMP